MQNPLLELADRAELPAFDRIRPEHVEPAVDALLARNRAELTQLLDRDAAPSWENLIQPLEEMGDRLSRIWPSVSQLWAVCNNEDWRKAYNACLPKITEYGLELAQSEPLFHAYERLSQSPGFEQQSIVRKKAVKDALRDFRLSGIALPPGEKARFKSLSLRVSELQTKFEENLVDATQAWTLHITDAARLTGMTESGLAQAAARARAKNLDGWLLTLDFPGYDAVIRYADDRALRETIYQAFATRASEVPSTSAGDLGSFSMTPADAGPQAGKNDNSAAMAEILKLRHEQAQLLGYANYAELSLATKMAESPAAVETFLLDLAAKSKARAKTELAEMREFAGLDDLKPWDIPYYAEKLKQKKLGLSDEELRPYFPAPQVMDGLFALVKKLYGISLERTEAPVWHAAVTAYTLKDGSGRPFSMFYLDPYAREHKRGGAWMDECRVRRRTAQGVQQPVAFLTCNFAPPLGDKPALLTHQEVVTLFHEFGHGLQHLLTQVEVAAVSGIRGVEWDAVELPSQFMENWCYAPESLALFARHHQTGQPLPAELIAKLQASRSFHSGLATLRQLEFSLFDLRLHRDFDSAKGARVYEILEQVRNEISVLKPPVWNRFPHSFSHIFAGGYAAGYYSYKWAEVLSADAFAAFEEEGLFNPAVGHRFRDTVLAQGGSRPAMELFEAFRGRKPRIGPLLKQSGLLEATV